MLVMPVNILVMPASERASPYAIFYNYSIIIHENSLRAST